MKGIGEKMANEKTDNKKKPASKRDIIFEIGEIKKVEDSHDIPVRLIITDQKGALANDVEVKIEDEKLKVLDISKSTYGYISYLYQPESAPGKTLTITASTTIEGVFVRKQHKIELPKSPIQKAKHIKLRYSESWFEEGKGRDEKWKLLIFTRFYAVVTGDDGVLEGVEVEFVDDFPDAVFDSADSLTNRDGRVNFDYKRAAFKLYGKDKKIVARVKGTDIIDEVTVNIMPSFENLPPDTKNRAKQIRKNYIEYNKQVRKTDIGRHILKTTLIFVPALLSMFFTWRVVGILSGSPEAISTLFGVLIGTMFFKRDKDNRLRGLLTLVVCTLLGYFLAFLSTDIIILAIGCVLVAEPFYYLEKVNFRVQETEENGKIKTKWKSWANFYPWWCHGGFAILFWLNMVGFVFNGIMLIKGEYSGFSHGFVMETAVDLMNRSDLLDYIPSNLRIFRYHIEVFFGLILGNAMLLLYAAPGEFMDMIQGKSPEASAGRVFERLIFIDQIFDWLRRKPVKA